MNQQVGWRHVLEEGFRPMIGRLEVAQRRVQPNGREHQLGIVPDVFVQRGQPPLRLARIAALQQQVHEEFYVLAAGRAGLAGVAGADDGALDFAPAQLAERAQAQQGWVGRPRIERLVEERLGPPQFPRSI